MPPTRAQPEVGAIVVVRIETVVVFPAAVRAKQAEQLPLGSVKGHVVNRVGRGASVPLGQMLHLDRAHARSFTVGGQQDSRSRR